MNIKNMAEMAKEILKKDKMLHPVLFLEDTKNKITIMNLPEFGSDEEHDKYKMMEIAGRTAFKNKIMIKEIIFISESWVSMVKDKKMNEKDAEKIIPSKDPNKKEAIIISQWDLLKNEKMIFMRIFKKVKEEIVWEGKEKIMKGNQRIYILEPFIKGYSEKIIDKIEKSSENEVKINKISN